MKKLLALLTALLMLTLPLSALASTLDLSFVRNHTDKLYTIDVDTASDLAFIESQLSIEGRSFTHKYDSAYRYSYLKWDVLVMDYSAGANAVPCLRLWVVYAADNRHQNINSVTFTIDGVDYTFTGVGSAERRTHDENGYRESMLIKFGMNNLDFLVAMDRVIPDDHDSVDDLANLPITLTLHGDEEFTVHLGSGFVLDFLAMEDAFIESNGLDYFDQDLFTTTPVTIK